MLGSYVCLLMVTLIKVSLNKRQYMQLQMKISRPVIVIHWVAHRFQMAVLDAVKICSYLDRF